MRKRSGKFQDLLVQNKKINVCIPFVKTDHLNLHSKEVCSALAYGYILKLLAISLPVDYIWRCKFNIGFLETIDLFERITRLAFYNYIYYIYIYIKMLCRFYRRLYCCASFSFIRVQSIFFVLFEPSFVYESLLTIK